MSLRTRRPTRATGPWVGADMCWLVLVIRCCPLTWACCPLTWACFGSAGTRGRGSMWTSSTVFWTWALICPMITLFARAASPGTCRVACCTAWHPAPSAGACWYSSCGCGCGCGCAVTVLWRAVCYVCAVSVTVTVRPCLLVADWCWQTDSFFPFFFGGVCPIHVFQAFRISRTQTPHCALDLRLIPTNFHVLLVLVLVLVLVLSPHAAAHTPCACSAQ